MIWAVDPISVECMVGVAIDVGRLRSLDAWVEVLGRLHPIVVHFPIALLVVAAVFEAGAMVGLGRPAAAEGTSTSAPHPVARPCLVIGALGAVAAAVSGWTLASNEPLGGSEAGVVTLHRWIAIAATVIALAAWWLGSRQGTAAQRGYRTLVFVGALAVGVAGHFGGSLVHGGDHLLEPFHVRVPDAPADPDSPAVIAITPEVGAIFAASCLDCHGPRRQRGGLRLDDPASLARSGSVVAGDPGGSDLLRRVQLAAHEVEAMPPEGDPRLSAGSIDVLRAWIASTVPVEAPAGDGGGERTSSATATDAAAAAGETSRGTAPTADRPARTAAERAARRTSIERLTEFGAAVAPVARDSDALAIHLNLAGRAVTDDTLEALAGVADTVVTLDLTGTAITDAGAPRLATMAAVRTLSLARTEVGDETVRALATLPELRSLNLFGTQVTDASLDVVAEMTSLEVVYLFDTAVTGDAVERLRGRRGDLDVIVGGD